MFCPGILDEHSINACLLIPKHFILVQREDTDTVCCSWLLLILLKLIVKQAFRRWISGWILVILQINKVLLTKRGWKWVEASARTSISMLPNTMSRCIINRYLKTKWMNCKWLGLGLFRENDLNGKEAYTCCTSRVFNVATQSLLSSGTKSTRGQ